MDLERIKQNLRLRSGRPKKKQTIQERRAARPNVQPQKPPAAPTPTPKASMKDQYSQTDREKAEDKHAEGTETGQIATQQHTTTEGHQGAAEPVASKTVQCGQKASETDQPTNALDESDGADFDLHPPAPRARMPSLENTSELLFSSGHLDSILHDPPSISRFTAFLSRYRPEYQPLIVRYLETQKAIRAIEYANAVAASAEAINKADVKDVQETVPGSAARLEEAFEKASTAAFKALVGDALPQFITYNLVKLASECLINEVAGRQSGIMQSLVGGLSEVFCITDPNLPDNPIIYASEEFYRYTGYGSDDVIGNNCRFLQGPKTNRDSPRRIKEATEKGTEICETLLNYRRDGRPFINLLMIAPLHDNKGRVKYQIGAQVDVSGLVEKGRGLDTFSKYLTHKNSSHGRRSVAEGDERKQNALNKLRELSEMFDLEESAVVQRHSRANSSTRSDDSGSVRSKNRPKVLRRLFVSDSGSDKDEDEDEPNPAAEGPWKLGQQGPSGKPSGKLPGIYDSYMLIRPAPSLRIIFTSPKLQKQVKAVQSPFLSHIAAPPRTLAGLKESFLAGVPVSAKINFMASPGERRDGLKVTSGYSHEDAKYGKACWISATPLLGSDDRPGVWMVVFVEKSRVPKTGTARSAEVEAKAQAEARGPGKASAPTTEKTNGNAAGGALPESNTGSPAEGDLPIKPKRIDDVRAASSKPTEGGPPSSASGHEAYDYHEAQDEHLDDVDNSSETLIEAQPTSHSPPEFVQPKPRSGTQTPNIESLNRVVVQPSPDHEQQQQEFEQQHKQLQAESQEDQPHLTQQRSDTGYESTPKLTLDLQEQRKFTPPPDIDNSLLSKTPRTEEGERAEVNGQARDHGSSEDLENTPLATRTHTRRSSGEKARAEVRPVQSPALRADKAENDESKEEEQWEPVGKERPPMQRDPNGPSGLAIDYLAHPGSGRKRVHAEEFGRALQEKGGRQIEDEEDSDCLRTPYSVD